MKKTHLLALCIALCLALATSGTIAYLSDSSASVNVMTTHQVHVALHEKQRATDDNGQTIIENFSDNKMFYPMVGETDELDAYGMPVAENFLDKIIYVENLPTSSDAYLRVFIGVPADMVNLTRTDYASHEDDALHLFLGETVDLSGSYNADTHPAWPWIPGEDPSQTVMVDGREYYFQSYTHQGTVSANTETAVLMAGMYLDHRVTNDKQGYLFRHEGVDYRFDCSDMGSIFMPVLVQAVQAVGFTDRNDNGTAADEAFAASGMDDVSFDEIFNFGETVVQIGSAEGLVSILSSIGGGEGQLPPTLELISADNTPIDLSSASAVNALNEANAPVTMTVPEQQQTTLVLAQEGISNDDVSLVVDGKLIINADE